MLVERRGQLVSREEIVDRLWGKDVFVDVDTGVHTAVRKIRRALRDSTEEPAFIETVSGKGYRFIAPVMTPSLRGSGRCRQADCACHSRRPPRSSCRSRWTATPRASGSGCWRCDRDRPHHVDAARRDATPSRVTIAVLPFENLGGDPDRAYLADGLTEEIIAWLGQVDPDRLSVVSRTSATLAKRSGQVPRRDRARARRRLPSGELHSDRERPGAHHGQADSCARSGPGVVAALQPRAHQHARVAAGARRGDRRADPIPSFSATVRGAGAASTTQLPPRTMNTFAASPSPTNARRRRPETGDRALRACDDARSGVRAGLVGAGGRAFGRARSTATSLRSR